MTNKEKNPTKRYQQSFLLFTSVILILSILVGCGPSAEELEAVDYTPLPRDDWRGAAFNLELVLTGTLLIAFGWVSQKFSQRQSVITFASYPLNHSFLFQQPQFPVGVYRTNCSIVWAR